ncbi:MAG: shikimate dehydrogenase [Eggerthellaceae bacterium]|nr:shikimate dehydrogenase [Eggerthellaceae bacterium]
MTRKMYLIGHPVGHSKSAVMYNAVYGHAGLPWRYELLDCPTVEEARAVLEARDFLQVNITTPYKPLAYEAADERTKAVMLVGGANVLVNRCWRLTAHNTDGVGCTGFLAREGFPVEGSRIVICGTGPTALAILTACAWSGARQVLLLGRDGDHAREVLDGWSLRSACFDSGSRAPESEGEVRRELFCEMMHRAELRAFSYGEAEQAIPQADLVINATPLGMREGDPAPFPGELLRSGQWAFDCVYGHGETAFLAAARKAGCRAYDGAGMLVGQAVETVRIVTQAMRMPLPLSDDAMFDIMADAAGFRLSQR